MFIGVQLGLSTLLYGSTWLMPIIFFSPNNGVFFGNKKLNVEISNSMYEYLIIVFSNKLRKLMNRFVW